MKLIKGFLKQFKLNESTISTILGILVVLVMGTLVINYFRNIKHGEQTPEESMEMPVSSEEEKKIKIEELPTIYIVKEKDTLWKIAENIYGSGYNWIDLARENKLANPNFLIVGQELLIPKVEVRKPIPKEISPSFGEAITGDTYTVIKGDHLWGIALRAYGDGYRWVEIARENNLINPNLIHPGNILKIPR